RQDDLYLIVVRQIVEGRDDRPAVHLALIDLLRTVIEAARIAETDGVRGREQAERRMRADHLRLVEQRQPAGNLEHALNNEHHVRTAGVILVEYEGSVGLQRIRQDALAELGHLLAVLE